MPVTEKTRLTRPEARGAEYMCYCCGANLQSKDAVAEEVRAALVELVETFEAKSYGAHVPLLRDLVNEILPEEQRIK